MADNSVTRRPSHVLVPNDLVLDRRVAPKSFQAWLLIELHRCDDMISVHEVLARYGNMTPKAADKAINNLLETGWLKLAAEA